MKVYVAKEYDIYDDATKKRLGKSYIVGMSIIPAALIFATIFFFFVGIEPAILGKPMKFIWMGLLVWLLILFLSVYLAYDVYGNYLYYKGIWKDPPFAKSSLRIFWRDIKRGKKPYLLLGERKGNCTVFYFIYKRMFARGVDVVICDDELDKIGRKWIKKLKEEKDKIRELIFEYEKYGIRSLRIVYKDGKEIKLGRKEAELLGILYYLGGTDYKFLANAEAMRRLRVNYESGSK